MMQKSQAICKPFSGRAGIAFLYVTALALRTHRSAYAYAGTHTGRSAGRRFLSTAARLASRLSGRPVFPSRLFRGLAIHALLRLLIFAEGLPKVSYLTWKKDI